MSKLPRRSQGFTFYSNDSVIISCDCKLSMHVAFIRVLISVRSLVNSPMEILTTSAPKLISGSYSNLCVLLLRRHSLKNAQCLRIERSPMMNFAFCDNPTNSWNTWRWINRFSGLKWSKQARHYLACGLSQSTSRSVQSHCPLRYGHSRSTDRACCIVSGSSSDITLVLLLKEAFGR